MISSTHLLEYKYLNEISHNEIFLYKSDPIECSSNLIEIIHTKIHSELKITSDVLDQFTQQYFFFNFHPLGSEIENLVFIFIDFYQYKICSVSLFLKKKKEEIGSLNQRS